MAVSAIRMSPVCRHQSRNLAGRLGSNPWRAAKRTAMAYRNDMAGLKHADERAHQPAREPARQPVLPKARQPEHYPAQTRAPQPGLRPNHHCVRPGIASRGHGLSGGHRCDITAVTGRRGASGFLDGGFPLSIRSNSAETCLLPRWTRPTSSTTDDPKTNRYKTLPQDQQAADSVGP